MDGSLDVVEALLEADADVEIPDNGSFTPLHVASYEGHIGVVAALIEAGADVERPDESGRTPLYVASKEGHFDLVLVLIEAGADIDRPRDTGATPLYTASFEGHVDVVAALLETGADVDGPRDDSIAPIYVASQAGHSDVVAALVEAEADVDKPAVGMFTALSTASRYGHSAVVRALLRAGADPNIGNRFGEMPLHFASATLGFDSEKIVVDLLYAGTDIDAKAGDGDTPLIWAARYGNIATTRLLLLLGADRTVKNMYGNTALESICGCEDAGEGYIQCPDGGCDQQNTVEMIKDLLVS